MNASLDRRNGWSCCILCLGLLASGTTPVLSSTNSLEAAPAHAASPERADSHAKTALPGAAPALESALHVFPVLLDLQGKKLADGEFTQWLENDLLHVRITYDFGAGHQIEEKAIFQQLPRLIQEKWSWSETNHAELLRHFEVDFASGKAFADNREGKELKRRSGTVKIEPGRIFAGYGFVLAIKRLHEGLIKGEKVEVQAVGFTPKPRVVSVDLFYGGVDQMNMGGRTVSGDRFLIHPKIPLIAKAFVDVKDTRIWLTGSPPPFFLRWEGPLVEASDPIIRVDLLPGGPSGPAEPAGRNDKR